jgi:hypothetical protein
VETVWLLQGSRLITDWESRYPSAEAWAPLEKRKQSRVAARLVTLSQTYGLASREMSLVAVVARPGDHPGKLPETQVVPVGMAQDTKFEAYFRRQVRGGMAAPEASAPNAGICFSRSLDSYRAAPGGKPAFSRSSVRLSRRTDAVKVPADKARAAKSAEDILLDLASRMDSDGGMPGKNRESRAIATVIAVLAFLSQGHSPTGGAFRSHVVRLVSFLRSLTGLSSRRQEVVAAVIELARKGTAPAGEWITCAHTSGNHWREVERSVLSL